MSAPYYLLHESQLRRNLSLIRHIAEAAGVEFILAFKAYALWRTFPIFREYISSATASSPDEARMAYEEFGSKAHTYSPAFEADTFADILRWSSHVSFNSISQLKRFAPAAREAGVSIGLRINPEHSEIATALYDPCAPGSRFGVTAAALRDAGACEALPLGIDGFHCHCHCESSSYALEHTLGHIEDKFGPWLDRMQWLNLGGGHLVTRSDYDVPHLIRLLTDFRQRHPHLRVLLEPGSAFAWQTGELVAQVVDIVENSGIRTAILNASFTCHMPDCLEMPYQPAVRHAQSLSPGQGGESPHGTHRYRLGGCSCLSGDWMGDWTFDHPLQVGEDIVFEDMLHYTTVKTTTFNGIRHPSIILERLDGSRQLLRQYNYKDYHDRMD